MSDQKERKDVEAAALHLLHLLRRQSLLAYAGHAHAARYTHKEHYERINEFLSRPEVVEAYEGGSL
jgi:hypothetical protein